MPLTPAEKIIKENILAAPDLALNPITEATAGGNTRPTCVEHSSPTVEVGKKFCMDIGYGSIGPNDSNWGAVQAIDEDIR